MPEPLRRIRFFDEVEERVGAHPGVERAGMASRLPLDAEPLTTRVYAEGSALVEDAMLSEAELRTASASYFSAMGIPLVRGRGFTAADNADSGAVLAAVVTRAFAREILQDDDPVGRRVRLGGSSDDNAWYTIIGVTADLRDGAYRDAPRPQVFRHALQSPATTMQLVVRTSAPPDEIARAVRGIVGELAESAPVYDVRALDAVVARSQTAERFLTTLVLLFAGLGLGLASLGIYGVMTNTVAERTPEIGVRLALGAGPSTVLRDIMVRSLVLTGAGLAIGAVLAMLASRALTGLLYGVGTADARAYAIALIVVVGAASVAAVLPALRASRVDPMRALRAD
jgi:predicted permease